MTPGPNEAAQYGMVTACYFGLFMYRYNKGYIVTDRRAMINIALIFMLVQPLCRIIGGTNGLISFIGFCLSSIILLPSPSEDRRATQEEEKKKHKTDESMKRNRKHKESKTKQKIKTS